MLESTKLTVERYSRERERERKLRSSKVSLGRPDGTESIIDVRACQLDTIYRTRTMPLRSKFIIKLLLKTARILPC